jgi:hypothetical protein
VQLPNGDVPAEALVAFGRTLAPTDTYAGSPQNPDVDAFIKLGQTLAQQPATFHAGGYSDAFGWHPTFCLSCHGNDAGAQLKLQAAETTKNHSWSIFAAENLLPFLMGPIGDSFAIEEEIVSAGGSAARAAISGASSVGRNSIRVRSSAPGELLTPNDFAAEAKAIMDRAAEGIPKNAEWALRVPPGQGRIGFIDENGRIVAERVMGDGDYLLGKGVTHSQLAAENGLIDAAGNLKPGIEAFSIYNNSGELIISGSGDFNAAVSAGAEARLRRIFLR